MIWNKTRILQELKRLHKANKNLSYNGLAQPAVAGFGGGVSLWLLSQSGRAGRDRLRQHRPPAALDEAEYYRADQKCPAQKRGSALVGGDAPAATSWARPRSPPCSRGCSASGSVRCRRLAWTRMTSAGIARWDRNSIVFELRTRFRDEEQMNSGAIQSDDPGLHAAAVRHFGNYDAALRAAKLDPQDIRQRHSWKKPEVIKAIKAAAKAGKNLADSAMRTQTPALYGAAVRLFGTFTAARQAAGIKFSRERSKVLPCAEEVRKRASVVADAPLLATYSATTLARLRSPLRHRACFRKIAFANPPPRKQRYAPYPRGCFTNQFHADRMMLCGSLCLASQPSRFLAREGSAYSAIASPARRGP